VKSIFSIGFVGLTHLGLNYLAASSEKGFNVIGVDLSNEKINRLKKFDIEYDEPNLKKIIIKNKKKIFFSSNLKDLKDCRIVFISPDVPTDSKGRSNFSSLKKLVSSSLKLLNKKSILVILSQVYPGFTRSIKLDRARLYYQVETLIFGEAMFRALKPERIIIGCDSSETKINRFLLNYLNNFKCPIIKMKYESAELTKISINILLASSITSTNMLSEVCEKVSADWNEIKPALQLDQRIGKKAYLKPGLGISGGNVERDIYSIHSLLEKSKKPLSIIKAFQQNSKYMKSWVYRILKREKFFFRKDKLNIGILGLAYKENTNFIKNSPTLHLLKDLKNIKTKIYDPKAKLKYKNKNCDEVKNINFLIKSSNLIIIMTPWKEFYKINKILNAQKNRKIVLIDPYRVVNFKKIQKKNFKYFTIGK